MTSNGSIPKRITGPVLLEPNAIDLIGRFLLVSFI